MASPQVGSVSAKLSFARVAAMNAPMAGATSNSSEDKIANSNDTANRRKPQSTIRSPPPISISKPVIPIVTAVPTQKSPEVGPVVGAIEGLSLVKNASSGGNGTRSAESGESLEDDQSHLSNSSMKQQSFETKSMASVTTFAMDEKESIRPDDSASVRAVDDDESIPSLSRNTTFHSESDVIMPSLRAGPRIGIPGLLTASRRFHTLTNPPRFGEMPLSPGLETNDAATNQMLLSTEPHEERRVRMPSLPVTPDEKLLDALASPKDRLPILQLEEKLLGFIGQSSIDFMDLPPQNSFARLLAHKLADYYSLAHHINEDGTSIRIFRTPNVALPTPLAIVAKSIPIGTTQPLGLTAMKIMRRAGLGPRQFSAGGSTGASSSAPSKPTSEAGMETNSDEGIISPSEGTPNRDKSKLTREEREAQYKAARERIFADFQESMTNESASTGENSASLSRSSSSSGKKKNRKQKAPKDDSFEARSAFIPSYANSIPMSNPQMQYQPHYAEQTFQNPYVGSPGPYNSAMAYGSTPTQAFPGFDQGMQFNPQISYAPGSTSNFGSPEPWSGVQSPSPGGYFNYSQQASGYPQNMSPMMPQMNSQYMHSTGSGMQQSQNWMNHQFPVSYQQQNNSVNQNVSGWNGSFPYQYGQLPSQSFPASTQFNAQHPVPGSYNRSLFNPQTRSFVPNNASNRNLGRNGRKKASPAAGQNRTGALLKSNGSDQSSNGRTQSPARQDNAQSSLPKPREDSLQQKYGAPAHLPKKPPPSQVTPTFDLESTNNSGSNIGQVIGQGVNLGGSVSTSSTTT